MPPTNPPKFNPPKIVPGRTYTAYAVMVPTDRSDLPSGRGPFIPDSYHWTEGGAKFAAKGLGVSGADASVEAVSIIADTDKSLRPVKAIVEVRVPTEAVLLQESIERKLAKAGLTEDERKALGLPPLSA